MILLVNGEASQHVEYFAFGETFVEEHSNTDRTPYLFNGKELDEETGLYYYGARYYDAKTSVWQSVDPLVLYDPVMEVEAYLDGQHNGGVFNSGNLASYSYTYGNPIKYIDPNGKQNIAVGFHKKGKEAGTFEGRAARTKNMNVKTTVNTGESLLNVLKNNSSEKNPIKKLVIYTHASSEGMYADSEEGFYTNQSFKSSFIDIWGEGAELSDLKDMIDSKDVVFAKNAEVYLIGCNMANGTNNDKNIENFAQQFSETVMGDVKVIAPDGYSASVNKKNSKGKLYETGRFSSTRGTHRDSNGIQNASPGRWQTFVNGKNTSTTTSNKINPNK